MEKYKVLKNSRKTMHKTTLGKYGNAITILFALFFLSGSICLLASCQGGKSLTSKEIAATVNDADIYKEDVQKRVNAIVKTQPDAYGGKSGEKRKKELETRIIDSLVSDRLLIEEAIKQGVKISEA
ncbi:MAG: SurA N-terminal domain-containing protein, partial [Rubrobacteridae bacterium]|nr:SurA N-terminal domain-containing protein [Rubrobacteridae bacterium]